MPFQGRLRFCTGRSKLVAHDIDHVENIDGSRWLIDPIVHIAVLCVSCNE